MIGIVVYLQASSLAGLCSYTLRPLRHPAGRTIFAEFISQEYPKKWGSGDLNNWDKSAMICDNDSGVKKSAVQPRVTLCWCENTIYLENTNKNQENSLATSAEAIRVKRDELAAELIDLAKPILASPTSWMLQNCRMKTSPRMNCGPSPAPCKAWIKSSIRLARREHNKYRFGALNALLLAKEDVDL